MVTSWFNESFWLNIVHVNGDQNYHQQILWNNSSIRNVNGFVLCFFLLLFCFVFLVCLFVFVLVCFCCFVLFCFLTGTKKVLTILVIYYLKMVLF